MLIAPTTSQAASRAEVAFIDLTLRLSFVGAFRASTIASRQSGTPEEQRNQRRQAFIADNLDLLIIEAARGEGATLASLASLYGLKPDITANRLRDALLFNASLSTEQPAEQSAEKLDQQLSTQTLSQPLPQP